jgi:hypothetical protein
MSADMSKSKIQTLLDQKAKLDQQIKVETEKRLTNIGKMAKAEKMHHWSNEALQKLFKEASELGEGKYLNKSEEKQES